MVAPSGEQFEIDHDGYRAVVTECGAGLRLLTHDGADLVAGYDEHIGASGGRGQLLAPWPNRIRDGRYSFDGATRQLPLSEVARGNASHGLVRWSPWTLEERTPHSVSLTCRLMAQPGYPWTLDLHALYDVSADGLTATVTATNLSAGPAPYALGAHPYLTVGSGGIEDWELTLPAATSLTVDDRMLPTGTVEVADTGLDFRQARPIGSTTLDTAFTALSRGHDGRAEVRLHEPSTGRTTVLWADHRHSWLQVYTGDDLPSRARTAVAVEPMTSPPDAFNSGIDLVLLAAAGDAGDEHSASWGIRDEVRA